MRIRYRGNVFREPFPSSGSLFFLIKNLLPSNGRCFATVTEQRIYTLQYIVWRCESYRMDQWRRRWISCRLEEAVFARFRAWSRARILAVMYKKFSFSLFLSARFWGSTVRFRWWRPLCSSRFFLNKIHSVFQICITCALYKASLYDPRIDIEIFRYKSCWYHENILSISDDKRNTN
jgi:hypothetical protein